MPAGELDQAATAPSAQPAYAALGPGDPAPWFHQRSFGNPRYAFDTAAGRYLVLCFYGSATLPAGAAAIAAAKSRPDLFDDQHAAFFGVSSDPADEAEKRVADSYPGYRFLWDFDGRVARLYGALPQEHPAEPASDPAPLRPRWVLLDPTLRVMAILPFRSDGSDRQALLARLAALPPPERFAGVVLQAPVILLPDVFEPSLCRRLIDVHRTQGGEESGFMREVEGKTVIAYDPQHKRRRDVTVGDQALVRQLQARVLRRVVPEIRKVHQFAATRMERYIVACYDAADGGHFRPHRDNTTRGTAHRRFALSVNLNDDFAGGELVFPEYGPQTFKPRPGGAVVFSCSLLHAVTPVTVGRRYAFLPFLYDDAAAALREANNAHLGEGVGRYRSGAG